MRHLLVFLFILLCSGCAGRSEDMSRYYPDLVGGDFYLTDDMVLFEKAKGNYAFFKHSLVRQSSCCASGRQVALLPKGSKVRIHKVLRYRFFTNDCNEAVGEISINGKRVDFEYFVNCNYSGVKVAKNIPWQREL